MFPTGEIIFLDVNWNLGPRKTITLKDLPTKINCQDEKSEYTLVGFSNYEPGHYQAIIHRPNHTWLLIENLGQGKKIELSDSFKVQPGCICSFRVERSHNVVAL